MELYTGRTVKNTDFNYDYVGLKNATDKEGPGWYFSTSIKTAFEYAGKDGIVIIADVDTSKFLTTKSKIKLSDVKKLILAAPNLDDTLTNFAENKNKALKIAINSYIEYYDSALDSYQTIWHDFYMNEPVKYLEQLIKLGYNGHFGEMFTGGDFVEKSQHVVVYNNKVIKIKDVKSSKGINESKILVNKILKEIGDANIKSFVFKNIQDSDMLCRYSFITDQKIPYRVVFENEKLNDETSDNIWTLAFGNINEKINVIQTDTNVNKGEVYKVMATIVKIIKDFTKRYKGEIDAIAFSGSDDRRNNVYIKYIKTQLGLNWEIKAEDGNYFFIPEKQNSALISESYKLIDQIINNI